MNWRGRIKNGSCGGFKVHFREISFAPLELRLRFVLIRVHSWLKNFHGSEK
jgi:hypothetical protein